METLVKDAAKRKQRKSSSWLNDVVITNIKSLTHTQVPEIAVRGSTFKTRKKVLIAAVWMLYDQLGNRVAPNITLEIDLIESLIRDEAVYGDCFSADSMRYNRPRYFQIRLDAGLKLPVLLETLAHEIVHLRQYAKDQLYEYRNGDSRYAGKRYPKNSEDLPWEDEAHALEQHIYHRYTSQL